MTKKLPVIALTMGDPGGVGPEIILKACLDNSLYSYCQPLIIGCANVFSSCKKELNSAIEINEVFDISSIEPSSQRLFVYNEMKSAARFERGKPTKGGGAAAAFSIKTAVTLALNKKVDAITTAPISKEGLHLANYCYPGHTEMLADLTGTDRFAMMLTGGGLRVVLATTHMAIHRVTQSITRKSIETFLEIIHKAMPSFGLNSPRIAVAALNPHAGENGLFGNEEQTIITPAIASAQKKGINVAGPFPADTLFCETNRSLFDALLVMYHDQGLIPLKMIAFGKSVNVTLGLPIIRTSVDHGTAYDIAGMNKASPESLKEALSLAARMVKKHDPLQ